MDVKNSEIFSLCPCFLKAQSDKAQFLSNFVIWTQTYITNAVHVTLTMCEVQLCFCDIWKYDTCHTLPASLPAC